MKRKTFKATSDGSRPDCKPLNLTYAFDNVLGSNESATYCFQNKKFLIYCNSERTDHHVCVI